MGELTQGCFRETIWQGGSKMDLHIWKKKCFVLDLEGPRWLIKERKGMECEVGKSGGSWLGILEEQEASTCSTFHSSLLFHRVWRRRAEGSLVPSRDPRPDFLMETAGWWESRETGLRLAAQKILTSQVRCRSSSKPALLKGTPEQNSFFPDEALLLRSSFY